MRLHYLLVLPVMAVVLASGCTIPGMGTAIAGGKGIVVESFEPDFNQIYSTESVQLSLKLRNAGSVDGELKSIQITGVDWSGQNDFGGSTGTGSCSKIYGKMLPAVPSKGMTGETKSCTIELKPRQGEVLDGLSVTFYPVARVMYHYSTSTAKSITMGTSQELRAVMNNGGTLPADTVSTTSGPLAIDVISKSPVRVSDAGVDFPIEIHVSNVGGGIPCTDCSDAQNWYKVKLNVNNPEGLSFADSTCEGGDITLWRGKDNTIGCKIHADASSVAGRVQKIITVTADYDYITDAQTSVTVTGQSSNSNGFIS